MKLAALLGQDFQNAIVALSNEKLPMPTAYKLKKIVKKINEELVNYNELLAKLQEQHGVRLLGSSAFERRTSETCDQQNCVRR